MVARLRNIAKFPHATGVAKVTGPTLANFEDAHRRAFAAAVEQFDRIYRRLPDFDCLNFRGAHSTLTAVCEIWEEE